MCNLVNLNGNCVPGQQQGVSMRCHGQVLRILTHLFRDNCAARDSGSAPASGLAMGIALKAGLACTLRAPPLGIGWLSTIMCLGSFNVVDPTAASFFC